MVIMSLYYSDNDYPCLFIWQLLPVAPHNVLVSIVSGIQGQHSLLQNSTANLSTRNKSIVYFLLSTSDKKGIIDTPIDSYERKRNKDIFLLTQPTS